MDSVECGWCRGGKGQRKKFKNMVAVVGIEMGERVKVAGKVHLGSYGMEEEETYFVVGRIFGWSVSDCLAKRSPFFNLLTALSPPFCKKGRPFFRHFSPFLAFSKGGKFPLEHSVNDVDVDVVLEM